MREIDDAAEREDQRKAERDEQVISTDQQSVENLLEDEDELHADDSALKKSSVIADAARPSAMTQSSSNGSADLAGAVFRRGDRFHVLVRTGDGSQRIVNVPLVLHFG